MPRILSIAGCIAVLLAGSLHAQPPGNRAEEFPLPLEKVVLFTSGVGYFQHGGKVNNDAQVEMSFKSEHINDLLKSMVLEDLGGGTVSTVSYASRDPLTKTLETFAVNLTGNPSMGQLLGRLRGEAIDVDALAPASGAIVGVEKRAVPVGADKTIEKEFVTILTKDGLRTLPLDSITRIKLVDPRLQSELEKALAVLALGHDNEKKSVTLNFSGKGTRDVRVGYVQQTPIWKTTYRLVLDDVVGGNQAMLQGFAIVENTTDNDWKDVSMSLVSGRPISFVMDLYQPLYVPRPEVQQELYASLVPQVYGQDLAGANREFLAAADGSRKPADNPLVANQMRKRQLAANQLAAAPAGSFAKNESQDLPLDQLQGKTRDAKSMFEAAASVQSMAQGGALGELFRYEIAKPVTIQRQRSAMLPIVGEKVEAEKVAIYDERVMAKHPLAGLRLVNSTKLNLMQGPITVYDGGAYAGDARVEDMAPGSERLLSYAVDLDVEIAPRAVVKPEEIVSVRVEKGTLIASRKLAREKKFDVKNSGDKAVKVLVEYPLESGWKLVKPAKADEVTRDRQRFVVIAQPGKPAALDVAEEMLVDQRIVITNLDDNAILFYSNAKVTSPDVKKALAEIIRRKREIEQVVREKAASQQEIATVSQEQDRIRQNMQQLDRGSELYTRYVQKFAQQEDRVETLRKEVAQREKQEQEARRALDDFLSQL